MFHTGSKLRTTSLDDDWCYMPVEVFSNLVFSNGDDESILLFLYSFITSSVFGRLMLLGSDIVPLISNSLTSWSIVQIILVI